MDRKLGWALKLVAVDFLGISKVGQIVLARLMESQIWHQLASSVVGTVQKRNYGLCSS